MKWWNASTLFGLDYRLYSFGVFLVIDGCCSAPFSSLLTLVYIKAQHFNLFPLSCLCHANMDDNLEENLEYFIANKLCLNGHVIYSHPIYHPLFLSLIQEQRRRFWKVSRRATVQMRGTSSCRPWSRQLVNWCWLTSCCPNCWPGDTKSWSSPRWSAVWTSWKTTSSRDGEERGRNDKEGSEKGQGQGSVRKGKKGSNDGKKGKKLKKWLKGGSKRWLSERTVRRRGKTK